MRTAEAVNLISHYTACLIAVIGSSFPRHAGEGTLSPDPTLPSGVCWVLYYYRQEESPDNSCVCVWVSECLYPLYLPIDNARNCNFSFYCCGIIKWQDYLMQLNANRVCTRTYVCVNVYMYLIMFCGCPHGTHSCWPMMHCTVNNWAVRTSIMEPWLRLPRLNKLDGHKMLHTISSSFRK